ncbi:zinc finger, PHD-type containing protein [Tanacetum coccineum]
MEELKPFTHDHPLSLAYLNPNRKRENIEDEEEEEHGDEDEFYEEEKHGGQCNMCRKQIFHLHFVCYYECKSCDYLLHKFCAELPEIQNNHPLHPGHNLTLSERFQRDPPGLMLAPSQVYLSKCTDDFTHSHPLTLAYSFSFSEKIARFYPECRVCGLFFYEHLWIYKCDKCRYYVHVDCATSKRDAFMSILQKSSLGKTFKNYKDDDHPDLLHCPFNDEGDNLLKRGGMAGRDSFCLSDIYLHASWLCYSLRVIRDTNLISNPWIISTIRFEYHISDYFCEICEMNLPLGDGGFIIALKCGRVYACACVTLVLPKVSKLYIPKYQDWSLHLLSSSFGEEHLRSKATSSLAFVQGIERHGDCIECGETLQYEMIFKCLECKFAFHYDCADSYVESEAEARHVELIS